MPIIQEFDFTAAMPQHGSKKTFILNRWNPHKDKPKIITDLDGIELQYPVFSFYICVNRGKFPPFDPANGNEVEWMVSMTERTKGIAHELLYADQYAKYFDPYTNKCTKPIQIPTVEEDLALLCPSDLIEKNLHRIEADYGMKFSDGKSFLNQQATVAVQRYYTNWLKNHGVDRDSCHSKTLDYLDSGMRSRVHQFIESALHTCMKSHNIPHIDLAGFKKHVFKNTDFVKQYFSELSASGLVASVHEMIQHTEIWLNKHPAKK